RPGGMPPRTLRSGHSSLQRLPPARFLRSQPRESARPAPAGYAPAGVLAPLRALLHPQTRRPPSAYARVGAQHRTQRTGCSCHQGSRGHARAGSHWSADVVVTSTHQKNEFGGGGKGVQCGAAALARNTIKPISPATTPTTTQAAAAPPPGATRRSTTRCPSRARPLEGVHHNNSALTPTAAGNTRIIGRASTPRIHTTAPPRPPTMTPGRTISTAWTRCSGKAAVAQVRSHRPRPRSTRRRRSDCVAAPTDPSTISTAVSANSATAGATMPQPTTATSQAREMPGRGRGARIHSGAWTGPGSSAGPHASGGAPGVCATGAFGGGEVYRPCGQGGRQAGAPGEG